MEKYIYNNVTLYSDKTKHYTIFINCLTRKDGKKTRFTCCGSIKAGETEVFFHASEYGSDSRKVIEKALEKGIKNREKMLYGFFTPGKKKTSLYCNDTIINALIFTQATL